MAITPTLSYSHFQMRAAFSHSECLGHSQLQSASHNGCTSLTY